MDNPEARVVEGSNGLLLEVDGEIVPNYDAKFRPIEEGEVVTGHVVRIDKDEVLVDIGYKSEGVIPANELSIRKAVDPGEEVHLGEEVDAIVLNKEDQDGRLIMSKKRDRLQPGLVVEGQISNIVDFGAFVDLDGIDGLIHISELSWSHVNHPSEVLSIGDTVKVKVLDIDRDRQRISLGLKQTQEDPWQRVVDTYHVGDELEGTVTKVVTFGAFIEILPGVEGLVHISELAQHHVENPREVVSQGDLVSAKVIEVDAERRRLSLSLKRVEGGGVTQRADDLEAVEGTPNLELSEEVFPEEPVAEEPVAEEFVAEEPVAEEPMAEEPMAEEPMAEQPAAEGTEEAPPEDQLDQSI